VSNILMNAHLVLAEQNPIGLTSFNSPWEIPYLQRWSPGVQRQLPAEMLLKVSYVGSKCTHLLRTRDINPPLPVPSSPAARLAQMLCGRTWVQNVRKAVM
jgi:hypothetical protein